ncbi:Arp9p [Sugiyamaella lignohabitans]|uniref:Arp9p n=1 Tax=Sugiyamaella lignohabitans TaxID=796027 RepID=A0A167DDK9_9ASCO|nr:Arp9p [Sugiyamaella lignohabitans]ANB12794.1 Arp9p [Sugiyamaella lignohabitans]
MNKFTDYFCRAAQLQPSYAPELTIVGTALGGLVPNVSSVLLQINGGPFAGLIPAGINGMVAQYSELQDVINQYILPDKKAKFDDSKSQCLLSDFAEYVDTNFWTWFNNGNEFFYDARTQKVINENTMGVDPTQIPITPLYFYQSDEDEVAPIVATNTLYNQWCSKGVSINFQKSLVSEHISESIEGSAAAYSWLLDRLNGKPVAKGCSTATSLFSNALQNLQVFGSIIAATIELPTVVYKDPENEGKFKSTGVEKDAVRPIVASKIVDLAALNYFIKLIYKSATKPVASYIPPALLLVTPSQWTRGQIESITQYAFETIQVTGFTLIPTCQVVAYAHNTPFSLIIDIGKERTEISPISDFQVVENAVITIPYGGDSITSEITKLLPDLSWEQAEDLKKSPIYEVLSEDDTKNSWFGLNPDASEDNNLEDDGVVDVAAIVASGRTREILAERERAKQNEESGGAKKVEPPNMDREFNSFVDRNGKTIEVGKQRFHGTETLVDKLTFSVGEAIKRIDQIIRRQDIWDNLIITGRGSRIKGLKEAIFVNLQARFLILRPTTYSELPSTVNTGYNTPNANNGGGTPGFNNFNSHLNSAVNNPALHQGHGQAPTSIKLAKMPEYFPEWKGHGWEDVAFLGAEIAAKQYFTGSIDNVYMSRNDYNSFGPAYIWEVI